MIVNSKLYDEIENKLKVMMNYKSDNALQVITWKQ